MSPRTRTIRYGGSIFLVTVGVACGALISGTAGGTLATIFVGIGLVGAVSLIFYEVGLTEDHDRDRPGGAPDSPDPPQPPKSPAGPAAHPHPPSPPSRLRPDRMRGHRRRLF